MAGPVPADLLCSASDLATLPEVARRLAGLAEDTRADIEAICRVAMWDPSACARLLSSANDRRWGQSGLVDCVSRAAAILGEGGVRACLTGLPHARDFPGIPATLAKMDSFWSGSAHVAVAAREIADLGGKGRPNVVFAAGLLLDIGRLAMFRRAPPGLRQALECASESPSGGDLERCEREQLGYDHTRVGAALLSAWRLPGCLKSCAAYHHHPERTRHFRAEVAIAHVACSLAVLASQESEDLRDAPPVADAAWVRAGLEPEQGIALLPAVRRQAAEARRLFDL
jgi:HD-like signal output (HDOD) protein